MALLFLCTFQVVILNIEIFQNHLFVGARVNQDKIYIHSKKKHILESFLTFTLHSLYFHFHENLSQV